MNSNFPYHLIFFDMDGVIFEDVNSWMKLHEKLGTLEEGKKLTEKYLRTDYSRLVQEVVVKLWNGKPAKPYWDLIASRKYIPGVNKVFEYLHDKGVITCIISASPLDLARRAQKDLGIDLIFANSLGIQDGKIAGTFHWPVGEGRYEKPKIVRAIQEVYAVHKENCAYVGDSSNDIEAFKEVGLSIAFNSTNEDLCNQANHVIESTSLEDVLEVFRATQT